MAASAPALPTEALAYVGSGGSVRRSPKDVAGRRGRRATRGIGTRAIPSPPPCGEVEKSERSEDFSGGGMFEKLSPPGATISNGEFGAESGRWLYGQNAPEPVIRVVAIGTYRDPLELRFASLRTSTDGHPSKDHPERRAGECAEEQHERCPLSFLKHLFPRWANPVAQFVVCSVRDTNARGGQSKRDQPACNCSNQHRRPYIGDTSSAKEQIARPPNCEYPEQSETKIQKESCCFIAEDQAVHFPV